MAADLYGHDLTFTTVMDETFALFETDGPVLQEQWLAECPSPMYEDVTVAQPLLYAVNHALGRVVLSWGMRPAGLLGHSVGEVVAATLAGVLSLKDGVRVMRSRMRQFADSPPGGMLAVAATVEEVSDLLIDGVHLAAVNATRQLLLAGETPHLERARCILADRGVVCRDARVRQAFHSPAVAQAVTASLPDWRTVALHPTVTICGTIIFVKGKGFFRQEWTKSDAGFRTIVLPRFAVAVVMDRKLTAVDNPLDAIFASRVGTWLSPHNVRRQWRQARADTGLEWVTPHTFRKTVATLLDKEADTKRAASQLGHRTEQVTKKHYIEKPAIAPDSSEILEQLGTGRASAVAKRDGPRQTA
nr:acyltransferase domain-containing protein [Salinispora oceanensis]